MILHLRPKGFQTGVASSAGNLLHVQSSKTRAKARGFVPQLRVGAVGTATCLSCLLVAGPVPLGKWSGSVHFMVAKTVHGRQMVQLQNFAKRMNHMVVTYRFKADRSYESKSQNGAEVQQDRGRWEKKSGKIVLYGSFGPRTLIYNPVNKTLTMQLPNFHGVYGTEALKKLSN